MELAARTQLLEDAVETAGEGSNTASAYDAGVGSAGSASTFSTVRSSAVGENGFVKYSSAPRSSRDRVSPRPRP
jgi:hypothetical protein